MILGRGDFPPILAGLPPPLGLVLAVCFVLAILQLFWCAAGKIFAYCSRDFKKRAKMSQFLLDPCEFSGDESDSGSSLKDFVVEDDIEDGVKFTLNLLDKDLFSTLPRGPEIDVARQARSLDS